MIETAQRCINWARWARSDYNGLTYPPDASGFGQMLHDPEDKEGWNPEDAVGHRIVPIDWRDAAHIDRHLLLIARRHFLLIKRYFYRGHQVSRLELDAALRQLQDTLDKRREYPIVRMGGGSLAL